MTEQVTYILTPYAARRPEVRILDGYLVVGRTVMGRVTIAEAELDVIGQAGGSLAGRVHLGPTGQGRWACADTTGRVLARIAAADTEGLIVTLRGRGDAWVPHMEAAARLVFGVNAFTAQHYRQVAYTPGAQPAARR